MAINYNVTFERDDYTLTVYQETNYKLYYISNTNETLVTEGTIILYSSLAEFLIPVTKDGRYKMILTSEDEDDEEFEFNVVKFLQLSIIRDVRGFLCNCNCGCNDINENCISKTAKEALKRRALDTKLLSYEHYYVLRYLPDYTYNFVNFLSAALDTTPCNVQNQINAILHEECINGIDVKQYTKLYKLYVALYYMAMYFIELHLANGDLDKIEFIKEKFKYNTIVACLCDLCIDVEELEAIFFTPIETEGEGESGTDLLIYDEHLGSPNEWDMARYTTDPSSCDFDNTSDPSTGFISIRLKGVISGAGFTAKYSDFIRLADYRHLRFDIKVTQVESPVDIKITLINPDTNETRSILLVDRLFGYNSQNETYQTITIPTSAFLTDIQFDRITFGVGGNVLNYGNIFIDNINLKTLN